MKKGFFVTQNFGCLDFVAVVWHSFNLVLNKLFISKTKEEVIVTFIHIVFQMPFFKIKRSLLCASGNLFALHVLSKMKYLKKHTSIKLLVLFVVLHCVFAASNTKSPKSTREYHNEESSVFVYDNIFGPRLLAVSANMVKKFATWFFVHPDPYEGIEKQDNGDLHWIAPLSPKSFAESKIWKALKKGLEGAGIFEGKKLHPYDVEGTMLLRGFSPAVCKGKQK